MTVDQLLQALALPESTRVQQRVPKKLLVEHGAATAQDKRLIQDGVDEITWLASLKPHLIGVPDFEDEHRHYREAAVLGLTLRPGTRPARLVELLHRAVPHPLMLATTVDGHLGVSVAHLRRSQTEAEQMVLDGPPMSVQVPPDGGGAAFRAALALANQPRTNLLALVQGWMDTIAALDVAQETGSFVPSANRAQAEVRHAALQQLRDLRAQAGELRALAAKERQIARQVALNEELRGINAQMEELRQRLVVGAG
ncbi:MAG: DUF4391 domain-containing protein [Betaproteobacteria bacterium]|nr:DUF4391 domain-containing protein [Betaproteobacteria bacterium]MBK7518500.1 DUF4391 domain-containing protein [Betaproteobacteria bacterium]MBK8865809.1 DUF4391 domain-containing protein [Betaproteobacteria bacterium]MBL0298788.1 DUF4391 domain-containing protein [Betaproteobacteria bacterium]